MATNFGEVNADSVYYKNGYGGLEALDPGKYALATVTLTGLTGSPSVDIIDLIRERGFHVLRHALRWKRFRQHLQAHRPGGGTDWTDVAGLGPGRRQRLPADRHSD
jgi:hypothetical protein